MACFNYLLIDVSNSFTKVAYVRGGKFGPVRRIPTQEVAKRGLKANRMDLAVVSSVVPAVENALRESLETPLHWLSHRSPLGVGIDYPRPSSIGADRLANAAACFFHYGTPAIVVDFGTAVTFDVLTENGAYAGGVIAPGLNAMTDYLHEKTALLPRVKLREPRAAVGKTTEQAMLSGAVYGYRGLIRGVVEAVRREAFPRRRPKMVATGGYAELMAKEEGLFDVVDPLLTLRGLLRVGQHILEGA